MVRCASPTIHRTPLGDPETAARSLARLAELRRSLIEELLSQIQNPPEDVDTFVRGLLLEAPARAVLLQSCQNAMLVSRIFSLSYQIRDLQAAPRAS